MVIAIGAVERDPRGSSRARPAQCAHLESLPVRSHALPDFRPVTSPLIEIEALEKAYGKNRALCGLTMSVAPGPIGLLGPNGSGSAWE